MSSRFCFCRVKPVPGKGEQDDKEPLWLVIEWLEGESKPTKFVLTTLPKEMNKKEIIGIIQERWRTETINTTSPPTYRLNQPNPARHSHAPDDANIPQ